MEFAVSSNTYYKLRPKGFFILQLNTYNSRYLESELATEGFVELTTDDLSAKQLKLNPQIKGGGRESMSSSQRVSQTKIAYRGQ